MPGSVPRSSSPEPTTVFFAQVSLQPYQATAPPQRASTSLRQNRYPSHRIDQRTRTGRMKLDTFTSSVVAQAELVADGMAATIAAVCIVVGLPALLWFSRHSVKRTFHIGTALKWPRSPLRRRVRGILAQPRRMARAADPPQRARRAPVRRLFPGVDRQAGRLGARASRPSAWPFPAMSPPPAARSARFGRSKRQEERPAADRRRTRPLPAAPGEPDDRQARPPGTQRLFHLSLMESGVDFVACDNPHATG